MSQERLEKYVCVCVFIKYNSEQELYSITGGLAKGLTSSLKTLHGLFICRARHTYIQNLRSSLPHFCGKILTHGEWLYSLVTLYTAFCICVFHPGWVNGPHWIRGKIPWFLTFVAIERTVRSLCGLLHFNQKPTSFLEAGKRKLVFFWTVCSHKHVQQVHNRKMNFLNEWVTESFF